MAQLRLNLTLPGGGPTMLRYQTGPVDKFGRGLGQLRPTWTQDGSDTPPDRMANSPIRGILNAAVTGDKSGVPFPMNPGNRPKPAGGSMENAPVGGIIKAGMTGDRSAAPAPFNPDKIGAKARPKRAPMQGNPASAHLWAMLTAAAGANKTGASEQQKAAAYRANKKQLLGS